MILDDLSRSEQSLIDELLEWVRIPGISGSSDHVQALRDAAEWTRQRLARFCDDVAMTDDDPTLVIGRVKASTPNARTFLVYGHYDVQPEGTGWTSEPFAPAVRDGWLLGRGSSDDKGQFLALLRAIEMLAMAGELDINVVILADGEEEVLGLSSSNWLRQHADEFDGAILYDSSFLDAETPVINFSTRGLLEMEISCVTGTSNLHSGLAGGVALNALHVLISLLDALTPSDGRLPEPLLHGAIPPTAAEEGEWARLVSGEALVRSQGGRPADATAADEYYLRTLALPSLDVHEIIAPQGPRAVITTASARASMRLAPGQSADQIIPAIESIIASQHDRFPEAEISIAFPSQTDPSFCDPDNELIRAGVEAFRRVWKREARVLRAGGTLPIVAEMSKLGIPYLLTGLHLPEGNAHGPDEKIKIDHLFEGVRMSCLVLDALGGQRRVLLKEEVGVEEHA